ncbi:hypothetical protein LINGRAHAP2_LOCUS30161 [Linum grandiflorum]
MWNSRSCGKALRIAVPFPGGASDHTLG